jgi:hypothetical protein
LENDIVYEKDIGANTSALAGAMAAFHMIDRGPWIPWRD